MYSIITISGLNSPSQFISGEIPQSLFEWKTFGVRKNCTCVNDFVVDQLNGEPNFQWKCNFLKYEWMAQLDIYLQIFHVVVQTVSNQNGVFRKIWQ